MEIMGERDTHIADRNINIYRQCQYLLKEPGSICENMCLPWLDSVTFRDLSSRNEGIRVKGIWKAW